MTDEREHFSLQDIQAPATKGRYVDVSDVSVLELVPGLSFQPVLAENTMINFVSFEPDTEAPRHAHEEEQIVIVLDGEMEFDLDGDVRTMHAGDVAVVPPWVPHGAWTRGTTCREVDVFNPPRRTLLEHARGPADTIAGPTAGPESG